MKLKTLFDPKIIVSGVVATVLAGAVIAYGKKQFPQVFTPVSRGFDGRGA